MNILGMGYISSYPLIFYDMKNFKKFYLYRDVKCKVLDIFEHTNPVLGSKLIAKIFYIDILDNKRGKCRYVEVKDLTITEEDCTFIGDNIVELFRNHGYYEYYVEDELYNFINYDHFKI